MSGEILKVSNQVNYNDTGKQNTYTLANNINVAATGDAIRVIIEGKSEKHSSESSFL